MMTVEQQKIAVWEYMGWKYYMPSYNGPFTVRPYNGPFWSNNGGASYTLEPPPIDTSHDALRPALEKLAQDEELWAIFTIQLMITTGSKHNGLSLTVKKLMLATPLPILEALCRTLWPERF